MDNYRRPTPTDLERILAKLTGGSVITDVALQKADLDVLLPNGKTASVKFQAKAAETGNISLEMKRFVVGDPSDFTLGNFVRCRADYIAIAVPDRQGSFITFYVWEHSVLKALAEDQRWKRRTLTQGAIQDNIRRGVDRWNDAENVLIPLSVAKTKAFSHRFDWTKYL